MGTRRHDKCRNPGRHSLRKKPKSGDATTGFPAKWRLRNKPKNSILMTPHYPDLGRATWEIWCTTQIWVVTRHQYGISALISLTSFGGKTSGCVDKCRLFSQVMKDRERNSRQRTNGVRTGVLDWNLHRFQEQRPLMKENFLPWLT